MNAYIVRLENEMGELQAHHIFSDRAKADEFVGRQVLPEHLKQSFRVVEREAVPSAIQHLAARGR
jgi:hypothetical protein